VVAALRWVDVRWSDGVKLTVVGCSGSFPAPGSPASCYLVEVQDDDRTWRVVLDLGSGAVGPLQRHVGLGELDAVVISHLHPDHFMDLCGLYVARCYDPSGRSATPLRVYGPAGTQDRLVDAYGPDSVDELPRIFDVAPMADGESFQVGPIQVTPRLVNHPVPAFGLRLEHHGTVITYSGDTDSCDSLTELARGADLFLAEASFQENRDTARGIHLTGRRAGLTAARAGARRLMLTHIPVWTDPEVVRREAMEVFEGPVDVAEPGGTHLLSASPTLRA
jgi:ribonuclease BN (tRNA processing enzyme)